MKCCRLRHCERLQVKKEVRIRNGNTMFVLSFSLRRNHPLKVLFWEWNVFGVHAIKRIEESYKTAQRYFPLHKIINTKTIFFNKDETQIAFIFY